MNLAGIEEITPFEGVAEFKIYKYDDRIDLSDKEQFICDLKLVSIKVNPIYVERIGKSMDMLALVKNVNPKLDKSSIKEDIKSFILDEIWEESLEKENIDVIFIES